MSSESVSSKRELNAHTCETPRRFQHLNKGLGFWSTHLRPTPGSSTCATVQPTKRQTFCTRKEDRMLLGTQTGSIDRPWHRTLISSADVPVLFVQRGISGHGKTSTAGHVVSWLLLCRETMRNASPAEGTLKSRQGVCLESSDSTKKLLATASTLVAMASNLIAMASNPIAIACNLIAMASNLIAMASKHVLTGPLFTSNSIEAIWLSQDPCFQLEQFSCISIQPAVQAIKPMPYQSYEDRGRLFRSVLTFIVLWYPFILSTTYHKLPMTICHLL